MKDNMKNEQSIEETIKVLEIEDKQLNRTCSYRNCGCDISHMRSNAKFCCIEHKTYESIYEKRESKRVKSKFEYNNDLIEQIRTSDESIIELFKNIYK